MKLASSILALATLAMVLPAQAASYKEGAAPLVTAEAVNSPLKPIYRVSGVTDDGDSPGLGLATSFHCTNFGNVAEKLRFIIREPNGDATTKTVTVDEGRTFTASTHFTDVFFEDLVLTPGLEIRQGSAIIAATSTSTIFCSAMIVEADLTNATDGVSLHMVRFNPAPNTQE